MVQCIGSNWSATSNCVQVFDMNLTSSISCHSDDREKQLAALAVQTYQLAKQLRRRSRLPVAHIHAPQHLKELEAGSAVQVSHLCWPQ